MGSYHDPVSFSKTGLSLRMDPLHSLDTLISAHYCLNARQTDLSCRQDEIRYIWQVKGRWTIATFLFGFVGNSSSLKDNSLRLRDIESIY